MIIRRGWQTVAKASKRRDWSSELLANPGAVVIPEWVPPVKRARRPLGVNEEIVEVLLDVFDDFFEIVVAFVQKFANAGGVVTDRLLISGAKSRGDVVAEELHDLGFVGVGDRHRACVRFRGKSIVG